MKIAIIGSGVMGSGIAQVLAKKHTVIIRDVIPAALENAKKSITKNLEKLVSKEKMTKLEAKGRLLLYNSKKTIEIARMMDHTFITVQTAAPRVLEYKIRSIKQN